MGEEERAKNIYIIGAGASIGSSDGEIPGITGIFSKAKELHITARSAKTLKEEFWGLGGYVELKLGKSINRMSDKIDIEQVMTFIEIDLEQNDGAETYLNYKKTLINLIRNTIINCTGTSPRDGSDYAAFVGSINKDDTIITFNWDTLLDDALGKKEITSEDDDSAEQKKKFEANQYYNFYQDISAQVLRTIKHSSIERPYEEYDSSKGYYLKMHGSVDWYYCGNTGCRAANVVFPLYEYLQGDFYCSECHSKLSVLLVPPVLNKNYKQFPILRKIWNLAVKELEYANNLIIWGYSFPPTDLYSKWLIKREYRSLSSVTIINPACIRRSKDKSRPVAYNGNFLRYMKDLFPKKELKLYEYYEDFGKDLQIEEKYKLSKRKK